MYTLLLKYVCVCVWVQKQLYISILLADRGYHIYHYKIGMRREVTLHMFEEIFEAPKVSGTFEAPVGGGLNLKFLKKLVKSGYEECVGVALSKLVISLP